MHTSPPTLYIKGFAKTLDFDKLLPPTECHGNFYAITTDLRTSEIHHITDASMVDGQWCLTLTDGTTLLCLPEPKTPRKLKLARVIFNFKRDFYGNTYDVLMPEDYDKINIQKGINYRLLGFPEGRGAQEVITSSLVKFWSDSDGNHVLTLTGSHYVF